ncbi:MAG: tripartite tricarboxylate transporter TctB family protein [Saprospiraceae bacterium]|nr:tripartite tricarboxylate transporter TctB family protein [Saprospiraceae bacterium]
MFKSGWRPNRSFIYGLAFSALGVFTFVVSNAFPGLPEGHPGPGLFPLIMGACMSLIGLALMVQYRSQDDGNKHSMVGDWISIGILLLILIVFPWLRNLAGFPIALAISISGVAMLLKILHWKAIIVGTSTTLVVFLLFNKLLQVPL